MAHGSPETARGKWFTDNLFPLIESDCQFRSKATHVYNCVGFAIGKYKWWDESHEEGTSWPDDVPDDGMADSYVAFFETHGYRVCADGELEPGHEKIAVFAYRNGEFQHVARQRCDGVWVSKLGELEDIEHPITPMEGKHYGTIVRYMMRPQHPDTAAPIPERFRL